MEDESAKELEKCIFQKESHNTQPESKKLNNKCLVVINYVLISLFYGVVLFLSLIFSHSASELKLIERKGLKFE